MQTDEGYHRPLITLSNIVDILKCKYIFLYTTKKHLRNSYSTEEILRALDTQASSYTHLLIKKATLVKINKNWSILEYGALTLQNAKTGFTDSLFCCMFDASAVLFYYPEPC